MGPRLWLLGIVLAVAAEVAGGALIGLAVMAGGATACTAAHCVGGGTQLLWSGIALIAAASIVLVGLSTLRERRP